MKNNMTKGYVLLSVMMVSILISLSIAGFMKYSAQITVKEFHKDLAKLRGYWGAYGAKELGSNHDYKYYRLSSPTFLYSIRGKSYPADGKYKWKIIDDENSGIKNNDIFRRTLYSSDGNKMEKYVYEP